MLGIVVTAHLLPSCGAMQFAWPDGGTTPFRSEKATTWEGGFRVPALARWPGVIKAGIRSDSLVCLSDMMATYAAITGHDLTDEMMRSLKAGDAEFTGEDTCSGYRGSSPCERVLCYTAFATYEKK